MKKFGSLLCINSGLLKEKKDPMQLKMKPDTQEIYAFPAKFIAMTSVRKKNYVACCGILFSHERRRDVGLFLENIHIIPYGGTVTIA